MTTRNRATKRDPDPSPEPQAIEASPQGMIQALRRQRDQALDVAAQYEAVANDLLQENLGLKAILAERQASREESTDG